MKEMLFMVTKMRKQMEVLTSNVFYFFFFFFLLWVMPWIFVHLKCIWYVTYNSVCSTTAIFLLVLINAGFICQNYG